MSEIVMTITVTDDPSVGVQTHARDVSEEQIRPMLARAVRALQAEIGALEECPFHGKPARSSDAGGV